MSAEQRSENPSFRQRPDWNQPQPERLPEPTAWPAGLALAITFILWGFVSSFIISGVGVALFITAMVGWIGEIRHERKHK